MNFIGIGGQVVPADKAVVSVMDHGFMYGLGLFETFRTYNGVPSLLLRHLDRLTAGCESLGICYQPNIDELMNHISELLAASNLTEAYIRYTLTAGEGDLGLPVGDYESPQEIIYVKPLPETPALLYTEGRPLRLLHTRRNTPEGAVRLKSLHYMNNILAKRELTASSQPGAGPAEGLLLTADGYLSEGIVSNLFFVRDGVLYTPSVQTGILPGITRSCVIEAAAELGLTCEEGFYTWDELLQANEIFTTNSIQELVPVNALYDTDNRRKMVGAGKCGDLTAGLLQAYRKKARNLA
ncbi:4-amino-4-deoxychorismate lyase [Paenibacillus zeisoli]|uniref:4-amino-4-deoxychorismate lyase n=1 Tax=Paenibacillus zeisoli TaxID=2496267 RepID=A0A433X0X9_9BACL|nr:aminodeoxychorismate lyase [Paenibacillus zeisoli]RUT27748.1 4-amino-4-deoxychorismate lyase [Paenibacillus zeisoli]